MIGTAVDAQELLHESSVFAAHLLLRVICLNNSWYWALFTCCITPLYVLLKQNNEIRNNLIKGREDLSVYTYSLWGDLFLDSVSLSQNIKKS